MKALITTLGVLIVSALSLLAGEPQERSGAGTFVSFQDDTLTIKNQAGRLVYQQVSANFKTYQNNEDGPGARPVDAVAALSRVVPGAVVQVDVAARTICFGVDYRVIGAFRSYQDGKLHLVAADVPPGFIQQPSGNVVLAVDPATPVLESIQGGDYRLAGTAGAVLKSVMPGTLLTARSEYDVNRIEVIQIGASKRKIERYIGQTRGAVRGTFVSFADGILRIRGKGVTSAAANEYERQINTRIADHVPIVESIDGGAYQAVGADALRAVKEGAIVTIRKIEEVVLEVQIGVAKTTKD